MAASILHTCHQMVFSHQFTVTSIKRHNDFLVISDLILTILHWHVRQYNTTQYIILMCHISQANQKQFVKNMLSLSEDSRTDFIFTSPNTTFFLQQWNLSQRLKNLLTLKSSDEQNGQHDTEKQLLTKTDTHIDSFSNSYISIHIHFKYKQQTDTETLTKNSGKWQAAQTFTANQLMTYFVNKWWHFDLAVKLHKYANNLHNHCSRTITLQPLWAKSPTKGKNPNKAATIHSKPVNQTCHK
jgi:hypothetical protein